MGQVVALPQYAAARATVASGARPAQPVQSTDVSVVVCSDAFFDNLADEWQARRPPHAESRFGAEPLWRGPRSGMTLLFQRYLICRWRPPGATGWRLAVVCGL